MEKEPRYPLPDAIGLRRQLDEAQPMGIPVLDEFQRYRTKDKSARAIHPTQ